MLILLLLSSLQVAKAAKDVKVKNWRCSLERGKLGKGLAMFLLIPLLGWAMLVFVTVLLLLSCSCTMFALVLCNVPKGHTSNPHCKVWIRSAFLVLFSFPWLVWPNPPTNLPAIWPVCHEIRANLGCCSFLCVYTPGQTSLHLFLLVPILNLLALPITHFAGQIHLVQSLL